MGSIVNATVGVECETSTPGDKHIQFPCFTPDLFFYLLLPPIILEAAYSLYDKVFFDNLPTILVMAVIGSAINFLLIGLLLYIVFQIGAMGEIRGLLENPNDPYTLTVLQIFLFAAIISAVDPVAVLAIFQEVGVNPDLYFLVFGESLLNDGIAVVFYKTMNTLVTMEHNKVNIEFVQYLLGLASFLTVALGGLVIGILVGFLTALITKTTREVRVMEPLALLGMGYLAYMGAELFHWSGIISIIGCGLIQAHYAFKNISRKSHTTVKYFIKMASSTSDITIFLFLGIAVVKVRF
jgi:sodium/hydrogen exchanger 3